MNVTFSLLSNGLCLFLRRRPIANLNRPLHLHARFLTSRRKYFSSMPAVEVEYQSGNKSGSEKNIGITSTSAAFKDIIVERVDDVIKSEQDKRTYRALKLKNGLSVLLISDPDTDKSAAAMDVNVGHMQDPRNLPGLAHFCEHMLFMGTEKYPEENDYQKFLSAHGGCSNAYTSTDHTNYFFDVTPAHLEDAFDRFCQFFIQPLFTASATEREVMAVNSENNNNLQNDMWRLAQLERSLSNPLHDYSKFGTGNKETLLDQSKANGIDPRDELLKFHQRYYSSNLMCLCILGKESLDKLMSMVVPLLVNIDNKNLKSPQWNEHPYTAEQLKSRIEVTPVKDLRSLHISFPIPDVHPYYRSQPGHYLGHLLGHEGVGSLLSELKRLGWATTLVGGPRTAARGFGFFSVDVDLSEEGEQHIDDIIYMIYQYITMIKKRGVQEWIHHECAELNEMHFRFKDKQNPQSYVNQLATAMQYYPLKEVLYAPYMMPDYRPELINMLLELLNADNMSIVIISKKFEGKTDCKEKWYGTEYSVRPLASQLLEKCKTADTSSKLELPEANEFVPTKFDLVNRVSDAARFPEMILNDSMTRLWFKQDDEYLLPKCCVFIQLTSPYAYLDPLHTNLAQMYSLILKDALSEYVYNAELAGLHYGLECGKYGLQISVRGYNEKQPILLQKLLHKVVTLKPDRTRFEVLKEQYIRQLRNFDMEQPYQHAVYFTSLILTERVWNKDELLQEINGLTVENLEKYITQFISSLHIEALVYGNSTQENAVNLLDIVKSTLSETDALRPLFPSQMLRDREIQLPEGGCGHLFMEENKVHANSAVELYLQCGVQNTKQNALIELLSQIVHEPCFDQLRTKEQLGYIVFSGTRRSTGAQGLRIIVQSEKSPNYLEERVELFLTGMLDILKSMPDDEYNRHVEALAAKRLEKPKKMIGLASKYWGEITSQLYHFDRDNDEVECLRKITKDELTEFFEELISTNSLKRKKLSVWIAGNQTSIPEINACLKGAGDSAKANLIENVTLFKSSLPLYPLGMPAIDISPSRFTRSRL